MPTAWPSLVVRASMEVTLLVRAAVELALASMGPATPLMKLVALGAGVRKPGADDADFFRSARRIIFPCRSLSSFS